MSQCTARAKRPTKRARAKEKREEVKERKKRMSRALLRMKGCGGERREQGGRDKVSHSLVMKGATAFRDPSMTAQHDRNAQRATAFRGSAPGGGANTRSAGMSPSRPMAASRRGAPARDCRPAPSVDMSIPTYLYGVCINDEAIVRPAVSWRPIRGLSPCAGGDGIK